MDEARAITQCDRWQTPCSRLRCRRPHRALALLTECLITCAGRKDGVSSLMVETTLIAGIRCSRKPLRASASQFINSWYRTQLQIFLFFFLFQALEHISLLRKIMGQRKHNDTTLASICRTRSITWCARTSIARKRRRPTPARTEPPMPRQRPAHKDSEALSSPCAVTGGSHSQC